MGISYNPRTITDGLVLCLDAANPKSYPGSGTTWTDLSGRGNNGTLTNGPTYSSSNGGSIVFDGINDYVDTKSIQFERTDSFTISAWVNSSNVNNNQIVNNEDSSYRGYQFTIIGSNKLSFLLRNQVSSNFIGVSSVESLLPNKWYYLLVSYDGSSNASGVNLYVNGLVISKDITGNNLTSTTISGQTTWIGRRRPVTEGPFNGNIAQVSIYNRALTATEITQNYNALKSRYI
jgi:hypothetical protein